MSQDKQIKDTNQANTLVNGDRMAGNGSLEQHYSNQQHAVTGGRPSYTPLIGALEAIKAAKTSAAAEAAVQHFTRELGSRYRNADPADNKRPTDWQYNILENFKRVVEGDREWLSNLGTNVEWTPDAQARQILGLAATLAPRMMLRASAGAELKLPTKVEAEAEVARQLTYSRQISEDAIGDTEAILQAAGFAPRAVAKAIDLIRRYSQFSHSDDSGGVAAPVLAEQLTQLIAELDVVAQQGTISQTAFLSVRARWVKWRSEYTAPAPTQEQREGRNTAHNRVDNSPVMEEGERTLIQARNLRAWVDSKNGVLGNGLGDGYIIKWAVGLLENTGGKLGGVGGRLERALALPDTQYDKADRVRAETTEFNRLIDQIRYKGVDVVTSQDDKRETGFKILGYAKVGAAFIPVIGKPLSVALAGVESLARYESGDWGAAHALANVIASAVEAKYGESIVGEGSFAARALRKFAFSLASELSIELSKILGDKPLTDEQREEEIRKAIADCLIKAFLAAIGEIAKSAANSPEAHDLVKDAAKRLGIVNDKRIVHALSLLQ